MSSTEEQQPPQLTSPEVSNQEAIHSSGSEASIDDLPLGPKKTSTNTVDTSTTAGETTGMDTAGTTPINRPTLQPIPSSDSLRNTSQGGTASAGGGDSPQPNNNMNSSINSQNPHSPSNLFSPGTVKAGNDMLAALNRQPSTPMISTTVNLTIPENMKKLTRENVKLQKKESLGKGGFAEVVLGEAPTAIINPSAPELKENPDHKTKVAVKIMDKHQVSKSAFMNLQQEVDICAELSHPCLINTHGIFEDPDKIYIVMDLCGGGEMFKYIKKYGLEDMHIVAPNFMGEVVLGLEFMMSQGIIHRDIKPENLLLTDEYHVKIADFGTCCRVDDPNQKFAGTALYVAPETIATQKGSPVSDIWSLGCVLFQLFVGRPPFEGATHYQVIDAVKHRKFEFPPLFPADAKDLVDRMLQTEPEQRIGYKGFDEIKAHPFFAKVDWDNITTQSNVTYWNENFDKKWEAFLLKGESVVFSSKIKKERYAALSIKERILILTDYPRLFYLEPGSLTIKGQVPWSDKICAEVESKNKFHIHTSGTRVYHFDDMNDRAYLWATKINETLKKTQARDAAKFGTPASPTIAVRKK